MRESELQAILRDLEQVARAAAQLSSKAGAHSNSAARTTATQQRDPLEPMRRYTNDHPWRTLGIATGLGFLIGCMLTQRSRSSRESG